MATVSHAPRMVKVEAVSARGKRVVLAEYPIVGVEDLAILTPASPLSRMLCEGAGLEWVPRRIIVSVDGTVLWERRCVLGGATAKVSGGKTKVIRTVSLSGERVSLKAERCMSNRAYDAWRHPDYDVSDRIADELVEECGLRRGRPCKPAASVEESTDRGPYPCALAGSPAPLEGGAYHPIRAFHKSPVEFLIGNEWVS